ncbi:putative F-box/FBD/LRR-repeat protein At4g13965 [Lactuca sativa]|uniref:putative F-box/FBD/LRR-repeat protein At4g13965 n=1 Tax=Lactuca sativa TaxID=4236 RepID=UPI000CC8D782|nr:putative F-box/FBD/LRR-repeat protein At4g13965 [Lactuca sativa]
MILSPNPPFSCGIMELIRMLNDLFISTRKDAVDVEVDRLSSLPDELIHKILSFINIKDAISTSVLSSRWRFIWTSMPSLNFENLNNERYFFSFIYNVLSHRNNQVQLSSVKLVLGRTVRDDESVTRILSCKFSHNLEQLSVTRLPGGNIVECPYSIMAPPKWDLPALTTLHLHQVELSDYDDIGLFSKCTNLKNLSLNRCRMKETKVLNIFHPRLYDLTLVSTPPDMALEEVVNVVTPQLKNLTIIRCEGEHLISAPGLTSLVIEGSQSWYVSTPSGFHSLEKVELFMYDPFKADIHRIVSLLQQLHSVKLLTLNLGILKRLFSQRKSLSSSMKLVPHKACAFANTKILKFTTKPVVKVYLEVGAQEKVTTCTEIKNNDETSPSAIFPMVSCEEITAMENMASAQVFVKHLGILLEEVKQNRNSDDYKAERDVHSKPYVEMHWAWTLQWNLVAMMGVFKHKKTKAKLDNFLMMAQITKKYINRHDCTKSMNHPIIGWLHEMGGLFHHTEDLITQLSASKKAVMLPFFLSLCEEATILTVNILGWINTIM